MITNFLLVALLIASGLIIYLLYEIRFNLKEQDELNFNRYNLLRELSNSIIDNTNVLTLLPFKIEADAYKRELEFTKDFHSKARKFYDFQALSELREFATKASPDDKDFVPSVGLKDSLMEVCGYLFKARQLRNWEESSKVVFVNMLAGKITYEEAKEKIDYPPINDGFYSKEEEVEIEKKYKKFASDNWLNGKWEEHLKDLEAIEQK